MKVIQKKYVPLSQITSVVIIVAVVVSKSVIVVVVVRVIVEVVVREGRERGNIHDNFTKQLTV